MNLTDPTYEELREIAKLRFKIWVEAILRRDKAICAVRDAQEQRRLSLDALDSKRREMIRKGIPIPQEEGVTDGE